MPSYVLLWEGSCNPALNTEDIAVPAGKVVYMTRAPQIHDTGVQVSNCTQNVIYVMNPGGDGNSMKIAVNDNDTLCFTARTADDANSVMIDVTDPR